MDEVAGILYIRTDSSSGRDEFRTCLRTCIGCMVKAITWKLYLTCIFKPFYSKLPKVYCKYNFELKCTRNWNTFKAAAWMMQRITNNDAMSFRTVWTQRYQMNVSQTDWLEWKVTIVNMCNDPCCRVVICHDRSMTTSQLSQESDNSTSLFQMRKCQCYGREIMASSQLPKSNILQGHGSDKTWGCYSLAKAIVQ